MGLTIKSTAALVAVGAAMSVMTPNPVAAQSEVSDASYLFVFEGSDAKLTPKGGSSFELRMPIRGTSHEVTWFTDRPNRDAGHMSMSQFLGLWRTGGPNSFEADPPNVAIELGQKTLIATMINPKIETTKSGGEALVTKMSLVKANTLDSLKDTKKIGSHAKRAGGNAHAGALNSRTVEVFVDGYACVEPPWTCYPPPPVYPFCDIPC